MSSAKASDKKANEEPGKSSSEAKSEAEAKGRSHKDRIIVRACPKIVVYYPTVLAAFICGIVAYFYSDKPAVLEMVGEIFIIVLFFNTIVLAFEFPRLTAVAVFLLILALVLAVFLVDRYFNLFEPLKALYAYIHISANASFYWFFAGIFLFVYLVTWIITRFDCWEVTPNELLHHHGPFGDLERYPSPNLKLDKEMPDIFEFLLLGSGRLVFYPTSERRAIVLDNVMRVNTVERRIKHLLSAMEVRIDPDRGSGRD